MAQGSYLTAVVVLGMWWLVPETKGVDMAACSHEKQPTQQVQWVAAQVVVVGCLGPTKEHEPTH